MTNEGAVTIIYDSESDVESSLLIIVSLELTFERRTKMKKNCLVLLVLVAALMLFSAINASAACPDGPVGWCFEDNGVTVEVVTDPQDPTQFPQNVGGNSVFKYKITTLSGNRQVNFIDVLIPQCTSDLGDPLHSAYPPSGGSKYNFFGAGDGDPNTGFGLGQKTFRTFQWSYDGSAEISFTLNSKVFAYPNALFLNRGTGNFAYGQILSPACDQLPYRAFTQEVPYTFQKEANLMGMDTCMTSEDGSGCPTTIFSCSDLSTSACDCAEVDREYWTKGTILDLKIPQGKLRQVWSENDSRCPRTYWHSEGSCTLNLIVGGQAFQTVGSKVSGTVYSGGNPVYNAWMRRCVGTTCTSEDNSKKTNSSGYYQMCLPAWSGTLQPVKTGLPAFSSKNLVTDGSNNVTKNWP